jgi:large subunit ribosomal protein L19
VWISFSKYTGHVIILHLAAAGGFVLKKAISQLSERWITMNDLLKSVEEAENPNIPQLRPGDLVSVHLRIKEGNNERIQEFRGTIISQRGRGNDASFTVRRIASNGIGVERTFLTRSPRLEKVVVQRHSQVRRAKLYHLRERTGKNARLKQKFTA